MHRFHRMLLDQQIGVAGQLHAGSEFTPLLVGSTERHHVVAFTHPARFDRFRQAVQVDPGVQTQPLSGRDTFQRLVSSTIPLLINPQCRYSTEVNVAQMSSLLRGGEADYAAPTGAQEITAPTHGPLTAPQATAPPQGTPPGGSFAPPPQQPPPPPSGPLPLGPPQYVVPGLYERLAHYFDWLGAVDEAALIWCRWPNGGEGYLLTIRTQLPPPRVLAHINQPIGDLQGQYLDIRVDGWQAPPWTEGVRPFYARRR